MSPVPQRPFRGRDQREEGQIEPLFAALDGRVDSANLAASAVMPISTSAGPGTQILSSGGNVNWAWRSFSLASSAATQAITVTHDLSRIAQGYLNVLSRATDPPLSPVSVGQWNTFQAFFAIAATTATQSYRIILM